VSRCARHHKLAAGAVLDDLAPGELELFLRHRDMCASCRLAETQLASVLVHLALAAPPRVPPPAVLDRIRSAIRG